MAVQKYQLRRSLLTAALLAALTVPVGAAFAQDTATTEAERKAAAEAEAKKASDIGAVVVVGSHIKRTEVEGPAPVVVITREDIDREGYQTVGNMLQSLSQNTTANFTGDLATSGFTPNAQVINLRNLGPGYTLVLINGRRPAQYPQPYNRDNNVVNVKAIPSSLVERIEVLTGGASAIYGSDAVAGVVNIVTRTNYDGHFLRATVGTTEEGGGDSINFEYAGGATGDRWSGVWALQYAENDPVFASQREFLSGSDKGPRGGLPIVNPALSLIAIRASNPVPGIPLNHNTFYPGDAACDAFGYTEVTTAARGHYCGAYDQVASRSIWNEGKTWSAYGYGTFDLTDNVELFGSATYYSSEGKSSSGTEFWGTSGDQFMRSSSGAQRATYFDPQFGSLVQLQRVFNPFELGGPEAATTLYDENTYDLMFGARGTVFERFDWEANVSTSRYEYTADRPRLLAQAVHEYFLGSITPLGFTGGAPIYNLNLGRWSTPITPEIYESFSTRAVNKGTTKSSAFNFNVTGDLFDMPAGPLGFAAVVEAGRQETELLSDPRLNPLRPRDNQTVYNLVSSGQTHGERDHYAVGVEFSVPIFSNFTAHLAGRYDKYEDITEVDDAFTKMIGLEYRPTDSLLLRASYSTSFRAPDMQLVFAEGAASFSTITDEFACRSGTGIGQTPPPVPRDFSDCNATGDITRYSTQTTIAGNPLLKEEEGESFGMGFVWNMTKDMSISVDYWRIQLTDAASSLTSTFLLENEANCRLGVDRDGTPFQHAIDSAFCQNVLGLVTRLPPEPGTINDNRISRINSAYINTAEIDTSGIDATFEYDLDTDRWGNWGLDIAYSLQLTNRFREFSDEPLVDFRDNIGLSEQRSRVKGNLNWTKASWTVNLAGTRYGSNGNWAGGDFVDPLTGATQARRLPPYMLYNLTVQKKFGPNWTTQLSVVNLFDNQYRKDNSNFGYPFFDFTIGADPLGRRYYLSASYKFD